MEGDKFEEVTENKETPIPPQIPIEDQVKDDVSEDKLDDMENSTSKEDDKVETDKNDEQQEIPDEDKAEINDSDTILKEPEDSSETEENGTIDSAIVGPEAEDNTTDDSNSTDINTEVNTNNTTSENNTSENVVPETPKAPTIEPVDGDKAYAGDSVQFKVDGDVKEVQGLDGLDYTVSNGYLTVETNPNEATVLSPTVIGTDGNSTDTTSVTVNVIN